ncbi:hypothetical protein [Sphaerisporangium dianthi]|uniref:DUF2530 domain-containing protein n=1 Tax=Sphaerisporangium dianthi TaxID=1436120 RepID=A0ABV9CSF0_9ACTN
MENPHNRAVWTAIFCIAAAVVGLVVLVLALLGGERPTIAIITGGASFGGTLVLLLTIARFLWGGGRYRPEEE